MADWTKAMSQTFEYYLVDPGTWGNKQRIDTIKSSSISWDSDAETLGSASIELTEQLGECYIRIYLVVIQNGVKESFPLGTFLVQTTSSKFDGMVRSMPMDAYTPLLELKDTLPPLGYTISKDSNIMDYANKLVAQQARAPVVDAKCDTTLYSDFIANSDDTWLTFLTDLLANAKYQFGLDEMGRVIFLPIQEMTKLQPVWEFNDDNSSILYPDVSVSHDLYGIPNVVEVIYSSSTENQVFRVENNDTTSPISIVNRGREVVYRETNPDFTADPTTAQLEEYAKSLLKSKSSIEYTVSYSHGYCPVRVGDCVRLNYSRAGLDGVKAKVISQSIDCTPGCKVTETAVYTEQLWG